MPAALRTGDRPSRKGIAAHLDSVHAALPTTVKTVYGRADGGFYCWEVVQAYAQRNWRFIVVAHRTVRLPGASGGGGTPVYRARPPRPG